MAYCPICNIRFDWWYEELDKEEKENQYDINNI